MDLACIFRLAHFEYSPCPLIVQMQNFSPYPIIGYFLVSNLARIFIFVRSTNLPVYFYAVHQIRKRVPKFTSQFFECFNQSDRFSILFFVIKRFVKIRSGPEYEKNIFSRSLKKRLSPEKPETN